MTLNIRIRTHSKFGKGKRCSGPCGKLKPETAFGKDTSKASGLASLCLECRSTGRRAPNDIAGNHPTIPPGKCLRFHSCGRNALPGDDLCPVCAAYYRVGVSTRKHLRRLAAYRFKGMVLNA